MLRRWIPGVLLVIVVTLAVQTDPADACGGGYAYWYNPLDYFLSFDDVIVSGRIRTLSESGINAVLDVQHYLRGSGDERLILLNRENWAVIQVVEEARPYPIRCDYLDVRLSSDRLFLAGIRRMEDGSYYGRLILAGEDDTFTFYNSTRRDQTFLMTYDKMLAYLSRAFHMTPRVPRHSTMPRAAAVRLTTETGQQYLLPADGAPLISLPRPDPSHPDCGNMWISHCTTTVLAPNGFDRAVFVPEGTDTFPPFLDDLRYTPMFEGETGVISRNADLVAVWLNDELRIFATPYNPGLMTDLQAGSSHVSTFSASTDDPLISGAGAWSPDGRTLAFSTERAVWLWDALNSQSEPILFLQAGELPIHVRHFSPAGNLLALERGMRRYYIDIHSKLFYPDGAMSPDDRILAAYDTAAEGLTPLTLYSVLPVLTPLTRWQSYSPNIYQFEWTARTNYLYSACGEPINMPEWPGFDQFWCKIFKVRLIDGSEREYIDGIAFDYDPVTSSLATLVDSNTITVNGQVLDLDDQLDGLLTHIELIPLIDLDYRLM